MLRPYFSAPQSNLHADNVYLKARPGASRAQRSSLDFFRRHRKNRRRPRIDVGVADVFDGKKNWLARGLYNPKSQIRVRLLTWQKEEHRRRFLRAPAIRRARVSGNGIYPASTNAYRIVNGEGDFLPGLIVDRYADFLVCQFFTAGMALFKDDIVEALQRSRTQRRDL